MASNPATALADYLEEVRTVPGGSTVYRSRGMSNGTVTPSEWVEQSNAARLLGEVRQALLAMRAAGRNVDHYERAFGHWSRGVFVPDIHWGQSANGETEIITEAQLDQLRALADQIDASGLAMQLDDALATRVSSGLDDVESLLRDPSMELTQPVKAYLFHLTTSIRDVLAEHRTLGGVDLISRINELFGALTLIAEELERDDSTADLGGRLRTAARKVVPFMRWVGIGAAGALDVAANVQQLTGGLGS